MDTIYDYEIDFNSYKYKFTSQVLPLIDQGIRLVGIENWRFNRETCTCEFVGGQACPNCYAYGTENCSNHMHYMHVSFERIKKEKNCYILNKINMPWVVFKYMYPGNDEYNHNYLHRYTLTLKSNLKKEISKRFERNSNKIYFGNLLKREIESL